MTNPFVSTTSCFTEMTARPASCVSDQSDTCTFARLAGEWWDPRGPFRLLHRLNPLRIEYIKRQIGKPVNGLKILDIGCGGGLLAEAMAGEGGRVTALDTSPEVLKVAKRHAENAGLRIDYRLGCIEKFTSSARFDVVTAFEVIEHVDDIGYFLSAAAKALKPNGLLILATVNRTPQSYVFGILAAEYILEWIPRGMHDWRRFIRPSELVRRLERLGLETTDLTGVAFNPLSGEFGLDPHKMGINYMLTARRSR